MELVNELPNEIQFNTIKYMIHPVAELIKNDIEEHCHSFNNDRLWATNVLNKKKDDKKFLNEIIQVLSDECMGWNYTNTIKGIKQHIKINL